MKSNVRGPALLPVKPLKTGLLTLGTVTALVCLAIHSARAAEVDLSQGSWTNTGSLNTARWGHTATLMTNGLVLVAGGSGSAELYDESTGVWTITEPLNIQRFQHTATLLTNGLVLVAGGYDGINPISNSEIYNPVTAKWQETGAMNYRRRLHTATLLRTGQVLVVGGIDNAASSELYDPATGTWTTTGELSEGRYWHTATLLLDGRAVVAGGQGVFASSEAEIYDPVTGRWNYTGFMHEGRYGHTATLLGNGQVLVAGGSFQSSAELYDPNTGLWQRTGDMGIRRYLHTATRLLNGKVLVAGGDNFPNDGLRDAELYDPNQATWTAISPMNYGRFIHTATLLNDGNVVVAGGVVRGVTGTPSAELYIPPSNNPPIALCHSVLRDAGDNCQAAVTASELDNGSIDPEGDPITLSLDPAGPFPLGTNSVTLLVNDDHGNTNSCVATITVVDTTPPVIHSVSAQPDVLWPPNHQMVSVTIEVQATDNCGPTSSKITTVTSNETIEKGADWVITDALSVLLKAERLGRGEGRIYTIRVECSDDSGNSSFRSVTVAVPHDEGGENGSGTNR